MTCRFHKPFCNQALLCAYKPWAILEWTRLRSGSKILILRLPKIIIFREGLQKVENFTLGGSFMGFSMVKIHVLQKELKKRSSFHF